MLRIKLILQLLDDGLSQNKICAEVKCSKRLVSSVKKRADESGKAIGELLILPDDEFKTIFMPGELVPPREDDKLFMIGYNRGFSVSRTSEGAIESQIYTGNITQKGDGDKILYSIPSQPGSCGSPVLDDQCNVVAVHLTDTSLCRIMCGTPKSPYLPAWRRSQHYAHLRQSYEHCRALSS